MSWGETVPYALCYAGIMFPDARWSTCKSLTVRTLCTFLAILGGKNSYLLLMREIERIISSIHDSETIITAPRKQEKDHIYV